MDILTYVINSPQDAYDIITERINFRRFIQLPASYFTAYCNYPRILIICFVIVPRLIIALTGCIEMCIFHQYHYFLYTLCLLIPLLLFKSICYIFYSYSDSFINFLLLYIDVNSDDTCDFIFFLKSPKDVPQNGTFTYEEIVKRYDIFCHYYVIYSQILEFMVKLKTIQEAWNPLLTVITSSLYFVTTLFIIMHLF